jgi:hypothetical protein
VTGLQGVSPSCQIQSSFILKNGIFWDVIPIIRVKRISELGTTSAVTSSSYPHGIISQKIFFIVTAVKTGWAL